MKLWGPDGLLGIELISDAPKDRSRKNKRKKKFDAEREAAAAKRDSEALSFK